MSKLSIVIPTYNHLGDCLKPCIETLYRYTDLTDIEIIIVANGCTDNTREYVESLGKPFKLLWFDEALGYTKATNEGIKSSSGDFIILLNNDNEFLPQSKNSWIHMLLHPFAIDPSTGITGVSRIRCKELNDKSLLIFSCVMIKKEVFEKIGLLDEIFTPGSQEDFDFCIRALANGYKIFEVPDDILDFVYETRFPIWHKADVTVKEVKNWSTIFEKNKQILKNRYSKLVHVIVPTYDRHEQLKCVLNDLSKQTYKNIIVHIISDGPDETVQNIVEKIASVSKMNFEYNYIPEHKGGWGAPCRKHILKKIEDDSYVVFVDDDNSVYPEYIESLVYAMTEDVGIVYCQIILRNFSTAEKTVIVPNRDLDNTFLKGEIDSLSFMVRSKIAKQCLDKWDENEYNHDYEFIKECSKYCKSRFIEKVLGEHA